MAAGLNTLTWLTSPAGALTAASVAASMAANAVIWAGTWRQRDKPLVMSWAVWTALMGIGTVAAWQARQVPAAAYGAANVVGCGGVALLALRIPAGDRDEPVRVGSQQARLDVLLLPGVLAGLMLLGTPMFPAGHRWISTPGPAVAVTVATDLLAFIPTFAHCWSDPGHEPSLGYALYGASAAAALAAVAVQGRLLQLTATAYPAYEMAACTTAAVLSGYALRRARRPRPGLAEPPGLGRDGGWMLPGPDNWRTPPFPAAAQNPWFSRAVSAVPRSGPATPTRLPPPRPPRR